MTTANTSITIRAVEIQQIGVLVQLGDHVAKVETEPRRRWAVTIDHGHSAEIGALFDTEQQATEAAEALQTQLRALVDSDGQGPRLATRNGERLQ